MLPKFSPTDYYWYSMNWQICRCFSKIDVADIWMYVDAWWGGGQKVKEKITHEWWYVIKKNYLW